MEDFNLIIGIHSILCALENPKRKAIKLVGTEEAISDIKKSVKLENIEVEMYAPHKVQEEAKKYFRDLSLDYQRVPSGAFLIAEPIEYSILPELYEACGKDKNLKIICLDQVTDVHNAGAILRTANFYGIDYVIVPDKKSFGLTPSFFRIASGAAEYTKVIPVAKLTKTISKLKSLGVECLALSEHASGDLSGVLNSEEKNICLVFGREDTGISNAVLRLIDHKISLDSSGEIKSLNVSIAAAITMEKCFGKK